MSKVLFDELGGFDESCTQRPSQDLELSLRLKHRGYDIAYCPYIQLEEPWETGNTVVTELEKDRLLRV